MEVKEYKRLDVVRVSRPQGYVIGVVSRTFTSGGNPGLRVVGVSKGETAGVVELYCYKEDELELLWREANAQK